MMGETFDDLNDLLVRIVAQCDKEKADVMAEGVAEGRRRREEREAARGKQETGQ